MSETEKTETKINPEMSARDVLDFYTELENLGIQIWLDGGWGVDALLGNQTRTHGDLDIAIEKKYVDQVKQLLESRGWNLVPRDDTSEHNFHLGDDHGREIDFHVIELDEKGNGIYGPPENGEMYPADALTGVGTINSYSVKSISPEWMVKFHTGYPLRDTDHQDMQALHEKFGVELPEEYKPNKD